MAALTCRDIIRTALRKTGALSSGSEPTASEANEGLEALQSLYLEWIERALFGRLKAVSATADYEGKPGERVLANGFAITFPATVETDCQSGPPADLSLIIVVTAGEEPDARVYDANRAEWVAVSGLILSDDAPLAGRGSDGLSACLARKIAGDYGLSINPVVEGGANRFVSSLSMKRTAQTSEVSFS